MPKAICSIDGCERFCKGRGLCGMHYQRWKKANPDAPPMENPRRIQKGAPGPHKGQRGIWLNTGRTHFKPGQIAWNKDSGKLWTCEVCGIGFRVHGRRPRRFCSNRCQGLAMRGPSHPQWRGGVTSENEKQRKSRRYLDWRSAVFQRDGFTCQSCGAHGVPFHADHVKPFATHPELRFELSNGRTLCVPCHRATPTWGYGALKC